MKYFFCIILSMFFIQYSYGQVPKKMAISNSGCSLYSYCAMNFETSYSSDSSLMYISECVSGETNYGIICVKLKISTTNLNNAEQVLTAYLDYLKSSFNILKSVGYGKGLTLNNDKNTRGIQDYWEDKDKNNWKVKGWTNGNYIGVVYAYSPKELNEQKINIFLDGFRFPGMQ